MVTQSDRKHRHPVHRVYVLAMLLAVSGVLTFGCSTAFLFIVMQTVWQQHVYPAKDAIGGIAPYGCSESGRREDGPMRATKGEDRDLVPFVEDVNLPDSALVRVQLSDLWEISSRLAAIEPPVTHEMGPVH
jgi:hypothetical protein